MNEINSQTFVIIPAFNEEQVIRDAVQRVLRLGVSVVIVNDSSDDQTKEMVNDLPVWVLNHAINLGQGAALQTGIDFAIREGARQIVTFDADGQHSEKDIPLMINTLVGENLDIVLGSRFLGFPEQIGMMRKLLLKGAIIFTKVMTGLQLTDVHNGLRAFRVEVAEKLRITQNRMAHASEILSKISKFRLRFKEIPVTVRYTEYSKRKGQSTLGAFNILFDLLMRRLFP